MKNSYRITARKMVSRQMLTVHQHSKGRMPMGNPNFIPQLHSNAALDESKRASAAREAVESVPFMIVADEPALGINRMGRPYIPATTFRGKLRSLATNIITKGMTGLDHRIVAALSVGGKIERKDKSKAKNSGDTPMNDWLDRDFGIPLFALFGFNNPTFVKGFDSFSVLLSKGHFTLQPVPIVRQIPYSQNRGLLDLLSPAGIAEASDEIMANSENSSLRKESEDAIKAAKKVRDELRKDGASEEDIEAQQEEVEKLEAEAKTLKGSLDVSSAQLHHKWMIPERVEFSFSLQHRMTEVELGFLLTVLKAFGAEPFLGGDKGRGAGGDFEFEFLVERYDDDMLEFQELGTISNDTMDMALLTMIEKFEAEIGDIQTRIKNLKA